MSAKYRITVYKLNHETGKLRRHAELIRDPDTREHFTRARAQFWAEHMFREEYDPRDYEIYVEPVNQNWGTDMAVTIKGTITNWFPSKMGKTWVINGRFGNQNISTSGVKSISGNVVTTMSGSRYKLGKPMRTDWANFLRRIFAGKRDGTLNAARIGRAHVSMGLVEPSLITSEEAGVPVEILEMCLKEARRKRLLETGKKQLPKGEWLELRQSCVKRIQSYMSGRADGATSLKGMPPEFYSPKTVGAVPIVYASGRAMPAMSTICWEDEQLTRQAGGTKHTRCKVYPWEYDSAADFIDGARSRSRSKRSGKFRRVGTSKKHKACDHCGKQDLCSTVVMERPDGARLYIGKDCARKISLEDYEPKKVPPTWETQCLSEMRKHGFAITEREAFFLCLSAKNRGMTIKQLVKEEVRERNPNVKSYNPYVIGAGVAVGAAVTYGVAKATGVV